MHLDNKIEFGMRETDKDNILLEEGSKKLVIADEEIKKNVAYNNYAFQQNFPQIMSYLRKNEIFTATLLVNKKFAKFTRSIDFWLNIYLSRLDMKIHFFSNQSNNYLNKLACLLHDAIKADFFYLLFDTNYQRSWNLEIFFSLKVPIISSLILEKIQLSLKLNYLMKAKAKKKGIEEKVKCKLDELKDYGFGYLKFPNDELQTIGSIGDEKNKTQLMQREEKFSKFLKVFKNTINRDLETYKERFVKAKLDYLKLYFKILFWDDEASKLDIRSEEFYQLILAPISRYEIDMDDGSDSDNNNLKPYYSSSGRKKISGLELAVEMGNLHVLESCSKTIQSYLNLRYVFKAKFPETEIDNFPEKLLATAAGTGQEAVMQFLFDQGIRPESDSESRCHYYAAIHNAISQNRYGPAMLLIAQGAGVHVIPLDGRKPLIMLRYGQKFRALGLLILYAGNVDINDELFEFTLLAWVARSPWGYLERLGATDKSEIVIGNKVVHDLLEEIRSLIISAEPKKEKDQIAAAVTHSIRVFRGMNMVMSGFDELSKSSHYPYLLEAIRLLLILGADPAKVNDEKARQVINRMMSIITDQESLPVENKERGENKQFSPSPQKITYIKNFSFIEEQKKKDKPSDNTSVISTTFH